jgi:hypothetical protein
MATVIYNVTVISDDTAQYNRVVDRLQNEVTINEDSENLTVSFELTINNISV